MLFLAANPWSSKRLEIEGELHSIQNHLYSFSERELTFVPATAVRRLEVHRLILSYRPQIIHFSGHGSKDQGIVMLDETGAARNVAPEALGKLIEALSKEIFCVVLNACYTSGQAEILSKSIPYVVGLPGAIPDEAAIAFSVGFYDALAASSSVEDSYQLGCATMAMAAESGSPTPAAEPPRQVFRSGASRAPVPTEQPSLTPILFTGRPRLPENRPGSDVRQASRAATSSAEIYEKFEAVSRNSVRRLREKLPAGSEPSQSPIITRTDTGPDLAAFLRHESPIMALVGDSGSGKSTYVYQLVTGAVGSAQSLAVLFYDAHQIKAAGTLLERLALDFGVSGSEIFALLESAAESLESAGRRPLLVVDGINEVDIASAENIKITLDDLADRVGPPLKILYTCRSVFWNNVLQPEGSPPESLYFGGTMKLPGFSLPEARRAVDAYRSRFAFSGSFGEFSLELQERVRDPLMLRMLAEAYAGSPLPDFAPAVAIFAKYEERLSRRFRGGPTMSCLERMIRLKARAFLDGESPSDVFHLRDVLQDPLYASLAAQEKGNVPPHLKLEDEGVLTSFQEEEVLLRFNYERFYEFLLGRVLVQEWERTRGPGDSAISFVERALQGHYSISQGLKSELVRRHTLKTRPSFFQKLTEPENLSRLLDGPCRGFAKDLLRELMFDAGVDVSKLIYQAKGRDSGSKLLLIDLAPEAPEVSSALLDCLFSGDQSLVLRTSQLLPNVLRRADVRHRLEAELLERLGRFTPTAATALIVFLANLFTLERRAGNSAAAVCSRWLQDGLAASGLDRDEFVAVLADSFTELVRREGPKFYGLGFTEAELEYPWRAMHQDERERALQANALIVDFTLLRHAEFRELASFFGSSVRRWRDFEQGRLDDRNDYQLETRIVQWALMKYSTHDFEDFVALLERFVASGHGRAMDVALATMDYALNVFHSSEPARLREGFDRMVAWDRALRQTPHYDWALDEEDPFAINSIPFVMVAGVEARFFTPEGLPIRHLRERLLRGGRSALVALLTARWLWHEFPKKVLASLEVSLTRDEPPFPQWLDRILSEIYLVHPRLIEDFLWRNRVAPDRAGRIKHEHGMVQSTNVMHDGTELYKLLFSSGVAGRVAHWHRRIYETESLEAYCSELVRYLVLELLAGRPAQKEIN